MEKEKCITIHEPFDYTKWQRDLYADMSVEDLYNKIKSYEYQEIRTGINKQ